MASLSTCHVELFCLIKCKVFFNLICLTNLIHDYNFPGVKTKLHSVVIYSHNMIIVTYAFHVAAIRKR